MPISVFPNVLVMLGLDHRDDAVLRAIIDSAQRLGVQSVCVCHIENRDPLVGPLLGMGAGQEADAGSTPPALQAAERLLRQNLPEEIRVDAKLLVGPTEAVLVAAVDNSDIDLVVMGRNPAIDGQPGWGSSRRKLLRLTTCSVMVVPHGSEIDWSRVVCGMDFSQCARAALSVACGASDSVDAVYQYDPKAVVEAGRKQEEFRQQVANNARKLLERDVLSESSEGLARPNLIVHPGGKVADVLIRYAQVSPIVMGSRGMTPLAALLLGSSADRVAGRALGPVLIVRRKGSVLGLLERLVHKA
jgi:nucleotide-binding universal stress UspA family protein